MVIIGTGYFLNENDSAQANEYPSKINTVIFSDAAEGSILKGFELYYSAPYSVQISANNITFSRNRIRNHYYNSSPQGISIIADSLIGIVIENNYIEVRCNSPYTSYAIYSNSKGLNLSINNNYLSAYRNNYDLGKAIYLSGQSGTYSFANNVLNGNLSSHNGAYLNNILLDGSASGTNNFYYFNLCNSTQFGNDYGNQQNVNMSTVFVDHTSGVDNGLILAPGSPAIGTGFEGVDCGIFGGGNPYVLSGIPTIPSIFEITHTGIGSVATPIQVNFKAKSNR